MTKMSYAQDLGQPPGICDICFEQQTHHALDVGGHAFHCHHNDTQAIAKADCSGWLVEQGVSRAEYQRRAEAAVQALAIIDNRKASLN